MYEMENKEKLIAQIRQYYTSLYGWLTNNGVAAIEKIKTRNKGWNGDDDKQFLAYRAEINKLAGPETASLEQIKHVADLVVFGLFEWHFRERAGEFILGDLGRRIRDPGNK
jgi:hypothetical protein